MRNRSTGYSNCLKSCPLALTQASSHFLHWSVALLTMVSLQSAKTLTRCKIWLLLNGWMVVFTGCKAGYFGWGCRFHCDCLHGGNCDSITGHCAAGCADDRWGIGCLLGNCFMCILTFCIIYLLSVVHFRFINRLCTSFAFCFYSLMVWL